MLTNVVSAEDLGIVFRTRRSQLEYKTVRSTAVESALASGWSIQRTNKSSVRLQREKPVDLLVRDRVWSLLFRLGFTHLSDGEAGGLLLLSESGESSSSFHFDVVGIDDEVALGIRIRAASEPSRWRAFDRELASLEAMRTRFARAVHSQFPQLHKRQVVLANFLCNTHLTPAQRTKAKDSNVVLFDERDLEYYEKLTSHIGTAAKYQFFAEMLPGKKIPGLSLKIPAIRARIGGFYCYTFSISPAYLLKISYVSHRSKGKASDVGTYQRMITKPRLNKVREYISDDGIFPTNIVLNLDSRQIKFDAVEQPHSGDPDGGVLGLMSIRPAYKSAWVIDGQHRLFAYSGHAKAATSRLAVLAFEGLPMSTQAKLFIDINAKQKSVKQALLQELYANLKWDADDPATRTAAIISRAIQELGLDPESPFFQRIQTTDADKSETRCISLPSMFNALEKGSFYISRERQGHVVEFGPLGSDDNDVSLQRTTYVLKEWFDLIRRHVPDWWDLGSAQGGGLAMNDGVTALIYVLRSVYQHLEAQNLKLVQMSEEQLAERVEPFGNAAGEYLAALSEQERRAFRAFRGNQGVSRRMRHLQHAIREQIPEFDPPGLEDFLAAERKETNKNAQEIIVRIEQGLKRLVVSELKREFGPDESQWWIEGVPSNVRVKVSEIFERDNASRGAKEAYFDLIDYRTIATNHWDLFGPLLGYGTGNKDKKTSWLVFVNDKRRIVAHASSGKNVAPEELAQLEIYDQWFTERVKGLGEKDARGDEDDGAVDHET